MTRTTTQIHLSDMQYDSPKSAQQTHVYLDGQIIHDANHPGTACYEVLTGEVLIIRDGLIIDLVEADEYLNSDIWPNAAMIAWTDCVLKVVDARRPQPTPEQVAVLIAHYELEKHLALAA